MKVYQTSGPAVLTLDIDPMSTDPATTPHCALCQEQYWPPVAAYI